MVSDVLGLWAVKLQLHYLLACQGDGQAKFQVRSIVQVTGERQVIKLKCTKNVIVLVALFLSQASYASQDLFKTKEVVKFDPDGKGNSVNISYFGKTFSSPISLIKKSENVKSKDEAEIKKYIAFFDDLRKKYSSGDKDSYLSVWVPNERKAIAENISLDELKRIQGIYLNMADAKLAKVLLYGNYTFLYVLHTFSSGYKTMQTYVVVEQDAGKFFMTDSLASDPFYNYIAPVLDKRMFQ